jgi:hypothetical protein
MMKSFKEEAAPDYIIVLIYALFWIAIIFEYLIKR